MFPAKWYNHYGDAIPGSRGYATFFSFYFMMTGLHGIHIVVGIRLLSWLYVKAGKDAYTAPTTHRSTWWACTGTSST